MADIRYLIRQAHGGETRVISDGAWPYFQNQGYVIVETLGAPPGYALPALPVVHADDANALRPDTIQPVVWYGSVEPVHLDANKGDAWVTSGQGLNDAGIAAAIGNSSSATSVALKATLVPRGHTDYSGSGPMVELASLGSGAILHLLAGETFTGPYLVGLGVDHDSGVGLVASVKKGGIGASVSLETTSTSGAVGLLGQHLGAGTLVKLVSGNATGTLLELRNDFGGTGDLLSWGTGTGERNGHIDATGALIIENDDTDQNAVRIAPSGGGAVVGFYHYTGSPNLWFPSALVTSGNSLKLQQGNAAAIGGESLTTLIEMQNANSLGFFGKAPVARPTGVAVTAAGVHAALVSLGLITA